MSTLPRQPDSPADHARMSYEPPRLEVLGSIADLTQGEGSLSNDNAPSLPAATPGCGPFHNPDCIK